MTVYLSTEINQKAKDFESEAVTLHEQADAKRQEADNLMREADDAEAKASDREIAAQRLYVEERSVRDMERNGTLDETDIIDPGTTRRGIFG